MPQPLPVTQIFAFRAPIVKGREVTVPVQVHGDLHGLRADVSVWRSMAHDLLGATLGVEAPRKGGRKPPPPTLVEVVAGQSPFRRTGS